MDLILLEKVQNVGDLGDLVKVKSGFGRNYLVPQGMAVPATKENLAQFEAKNWVRLRLANPVWLKWW